MGLLLLDKVERQERVPKATRKDSATKNIQMHRQDKCVRPRTNSEMQKKWICKLSRRTSCMHVDLFGLPLPWTQELFELHTNVGKTRSWLNFINVSLRLHLSFVLLMNDGFTQAQKDVINSSVNTRHMVTVNMFSRANMYST